MEFIKIEDKLPYENEDVLIMEKNTQGEFYHFDIGYMYFKDKVPTWIKRGTDFNVENESWKVFAYCEIPATSQFKFKKTNDSELKICDHPKDKRSFIGSNILKCGVCDEEFS